jgi:hypothetical protein
MSQLSSSDAPGPKLRYDVTSIATQSFPTGFGVPNTFLASLGAVGSFFRPVNDYDKVVMEHIYFGGIW